VPGLWFEPLCAGILGSTDAAMPIRSVFGSNWMLGRFNLDIVRKIHGDLCKLTKVVLLLFRGFGDFEADTTGSW
jgi:hypothetical protein